MSGAKASDFSVALIAGGQSSRLGRDKAFVEMGRPPRPLWRIQLEKLRALDPARILISARAGQAFGEVVGAEILRDEVEGLGPLTGLATCLSATAHPHLLCLAVDMPLLSLDFLLRLLDLRTPGVGIAPRIEGRWEGLAAIYPRELAGLAEQRSRSEDRSLRGFLREAVVRGRMRPMEMGEDEARGFASLNTPEDLTEFERAALELG